MQKNGCRNKVRGQNTDRSGQTAPVREQSNPKCLTVSEVATWPSHNRWRTTYQVYPASCDKDSVHHERPEPGNDWPSLSTVSSQPSTMDNATVVEGDPAAVGVSSSLNKTCTIVPSIGHTSPDPIVWPLPTMQSPMAPNACLMMLAILSA